MKINIVKQQKKIVDLSPSSIITSNAHSMHTTLATTTTFFADPDQVTQLMLTTPTS
jgi:hypothetical protein